jgi:homoserine dehydrogenase
VHGGRGPAESWYAALPVLPAESARTRYQVRLDVDDKPGVLAHVSAVLAEHGVSIEAVRQSPADAAPAGATAADGDAPGVARLVITTHEAPEAALAATVAAIRDLGSVREVVSVLRVEGA